MSFLRNLFPEPLWQRQSGKIRGGESSVGLDAVALENGGQLAHMLRRVPGRTFVEHVYRLHAEEGLDFLPARFVGKSVPPFLQPRDDRIAVTRDLVTGHERAVLGRDVGKLNRILGAVDRRFEKGLPDAEQVVAQ